GEDVIILGFACSGLERQPLIFESRDCRGSAGAVVDGMAGGEHLVPGAARRLTQRISRTLETEATLDLELLKLDIAKRVGGIDAFDDVAVVCDPGSEVGIRRTRGSLRHELIWIRIEEIRGQ